ncbi:MAG: hypothetical protein C5T88_01820 [Williamsoniiplasma luminosum]|uniref:Uncharacterized protein n=1 Tax=Williamsoniiplasma luminosum TaxID=214888 RepID=A0A2S0NJX1_9MOLU|nr:MAG: hypothetical protein C5T88_01820 [Williamsoniiplasma luminosum]
MSRKLEWSTKYKKIKPQIFAKVCGFDWLKKISNHNSRFLFLRSKKPNKCSLFGDCIFKN